MSEVRSEADVSRIADLAALMSTWPNHRLITAAH
jgi:hypothetical protein